MKKVISAFVVLVIVGSTFAFKPVIFGQGSVYCENTCQNLKNFISASDGTITAPCGVDAQGQPNPVYHLNGPICEALAVGTKYKATLPGK